MLARRTCLLNLRRHHSWRAGLAMASTRTQQQDSNLKTRPRARKLMLLCMLQFHMKRWQSKPLRTNSGLNVKWLWSLSSESVTAATNKHSVLPTSKRNWSLSSLAFLVPRLIVLLESLMKTSQDKSPSMNTTVHWRPITSEVTSQVHSMMILNPSNSSTNPHSDWSRLCVTVKSNQMSSSD